MSDADSIRVKGNEAFAAKDFVTAIRLYDEAIALDPRNVDLFNNRSAANFSLKKFDAAIEDAKRSIKITSNSKGFLRLGNAYWEQGKLEQARDAYELALAAAPTNQTAKDNLTRVRQILAASQGGTAQADGAFRPAANGQGGSMLPLWMDVAVILLAVVHIVSMFFSGMISLHAWRFALLAFAARQFLIVREAGLLAPKLETLKKWLSHFSAQYFLLCVLGYVASVPPLHLLLAAMSMYCIVDVAPHIGRMQDRIPPMVYDRILPHLQKATANRDLLIGNAATCEAMLTFMLFFSGSPVLFSIAYIQFIKYRYRSDPFSRLAFGALRQALERLTRHRLCPPVVDRMVGKLCDLLYRVGTG